MSIKDEPRSSPPSNKVDAVVKDACSSSSSPQLKVAVSSDSTCSPPAAAAIKIEIRCLIPSKDAGPIFGRGGANIKRLRSENGTVVRLPESNTPERLLIVYGSFDACFRTVAGLFPLFAERSSGDVSSSEFRMLVHQSQAGAIIGRAGVRVKELRAKHRLDIKIFAECCPGSTERLVRFKGNPENIVGCMRDIYEVLDLEQAAPLGLTVHYDPMNHDEYMCPSYGGFSRTGVPGEQLQQQQQQQQQQGPPIGGGGGGGGEYPGHHHHHHLRNNGQFPQTHQNPFEEPPPPPHANARSRLFALAGHDPADAAYHEFVDPADPFSPPTSNRLTLPNYLIQAVVGFNGSTLEEIKINSRTQINIMSAQEVNARMYNGSQVVAPSDSVINIVGTDAGVQRAQEMLQQAVRESGMWRA